MKEYYIEHEIITLLKNSYFDKGKDYPEFIIDWIEFSQWDFNYRLWCIWDKWIAKWNISANSWVEAINLFREKLKKVTSQISLIGQAYIDYSVNSFLVSHKQNFVFRYSKNWKTTWLTFWKNQIKALNKISKSNISNEFYKYWKDAINTTWYSAKILLMVCWVENIVNKKKIKWWKAIYTRNWELLKAIYWEELLVKLYWTPKNPSIWLRHKLVHWEYLDDTTSDNYVIEIHKKVIEYFNRDIFREKLISENVVSPQRHPFWTFEGYIWLPFENLWHKKYSLIQLIELFTINEKLPEESFRLLSPEEIKSF